MPRARRMGFLINSVMGLFLGSMNTNIKFTLQGINYIINACVCCLLGNSSKKARTSGVGEPPGLRNPGGCLTSKERPCNTPTHQACDCTTQKGFQAKLG